MIYGIHIWAVLAAAISAFILGGLWYSPLMFLNIWLRETGIDPTQKKKGHVTSVFVIAFILSLIAAFVFALFLGPNPVFISALGAGLGIGICWVATSFGINYLFANRSLKLLAIDAGYHIAQFTLYGIILGLWH